MADRFPALTFAILHMAIISIFPNILATTNGADMPIDIFLSNIQTGKWQDQVLPLRTIADKAARTEAKRKLPYATISGKFSTRSNAGLTEPSGFIAIDIDEVNPDDIKKAIRHDRFVYAAFASCSGRGVCLLFKINHEKHSETFEGLQDYLFNSYGIIVDPSGKDISRPRYVSYDPEIWINDHAAKFIKTGKAMFPGKPPKIRDIVFVQSDFTQIIDQITQSNVDITSSYRLWLNEGFALVEKFGEAGRGYFHAISKCHPRYDVKKTDRQYDACLNAGKSGITIATFYYICKQHGISIVSDEVREITKHAYEHKKGHSTREQSINTIVKFGGFEDTELISSIVNQVYDKDIYVEEASEIESGRIWIRAKEMKRNLVTGKVEIKGHPMSDVEFASLELQMREVMPDLDFSTITRLLQSDAIQSYHPIFNWFNANIDHKPTGAIDELFACIDSPTGAGTDYVQRMGKKWLVGAIACLYGEESHTMLVLCGEKMGKGKSHFFKRLLPLELDAYCAKKDFSMLGSDGFKRDMEVSITTNWLIYDDEMGGKSKRDHRVIKSMLATDYTSVRAAYGRHEERRKRISFFGGTTNDLDIIPDHGYNRRIIPIEVSQIDFERKDRVNPLDYWMEAYHLFFAGFDYRVLDAEIDFLNANTAQFKSISGEDEMLIQFFEKPSDPADPRGRYMTATQIKNKLDNFTKERINFGKLSAAIKQIGINQEFARVNGNVGRYYFIVEKDTTFGPPAVPEPVIPKSEELPF